MSPLPARGSDRIPASPGSRPARMASRIWMICVSAIARMPPRSAQNRILRQDLRWQASIFQARSCQRGKPKLDFETRTAVGHFNASPMEAGDRGNEAEAEPIARSAAASLKPVAWRHVDIHRREFPARHRRPKWRRRPRFLWLPRSLDPRHGHV